MSTRTTSVSPQEFLQLVADRQRWRLFSELARSDRRVGELTKLLGKPQNLVSYHLGELRDAGLVTARRSSADRRDTYYRLDLLHCRELLGAAGAELHPALDHRSMTTSALLPWPGRISLTLFLCTGNSARSQMAEALLEQRSDHAVHARSAGSHPKPLHPNTVRVMAEHGIDISGSVTKHLSRFAHTRFDRVITLCDKVKEICPEFPGQPTTAHWSMPDPAAGAIADRESYPEFQRTAEELETRINLLIAELRAEAQQRSHTRAK